MNYGVSVLHTCNPVPFCVSPTVLVSAASVMFPALREKWILVIKLALNLQHIINSKHSLAASVFFVKL